MSKLDDKVNEFLNAIYPNEPLWRNRQRFRTIKNYIVWDMKSLEKTDIKKKKPTRPKFGQLTYRNFTKNSKK